MKQEKLDSYKEYWKKRRKEEATSLKDRKGKAKSLARKCSNLLKDKYEVSVVYLVGSTVFPGRFSNKSDIDLLVQDLPDQEYFQALKECWDLLPADFEIDLIPWEEAPESLRDKAEREGEAV